MFDVISFAKAAILKLNGSGGKFLADDGTYKEIGGGGLIIDSAMSDTSTNAVQNKVIKKYVDDNSSTIEPSTDDNNAFVMGSDNKSYVKDLKPELDELKLYKFPNATIIGEPTINNGQISDFSADNYMQFPFIVDFKGRPFVINIDITTGDNITTQQNIFDSDFGFAFAVRSGKFVIAMSSNGTTWDLGEGVGTYDVKPNTTYKIKMSWDGNTYKVEYSIDNGETYITDISKDSTSSLYPKQIYIGVGENHGSVLNFFTGSINFNYCNLVIGSELVWQGMDDVGIATRLAVDISNIDEAGKEKIKEIALEDVDTEMSDTSENPVQNKVIKEYIDLHSSGASGKTYEKFVVVGITGQSNSVGYDESPLTMFDIPREPARIMQYSNALKPLTYMAESIQMMNTVGIRNQTAAANERMELDAWVDEERRTQAKTKGIHLPLANLILDVIPEDYGVIIVPGSYGGQGINMFTKGQNYYSQFVTRLKNAMNLNENNIFCGIIWCQGENNAGSMSGENYVNTLRQLINDTNNELQDYVKRSAHGSITEKDWYFYEWPVYYKNRDTQGILQALKLFFGNRYVHIPDDTPFNSTTFTTATREAHFADNSFRKTIAPRVFNAMQANGCFLNNSHDNDTHHDTSGLETGHEELVGKVSKLEGLVASLEKAIQELGGTVEKVADWVKVTANRITKAFGDGGTVEDGKVIPNNKTCGYLLPSEVTKVRFRYTATNSTGSNLAYLICYANPSNLSDVRAIDIDFNTSSAFQHQWVKASQGYNTTDGDLWSGASNDDVFRFSKQHDMLITLEKLEDGTIKLTAENGFEKTFQKPATSTELEVRFGFGGLQGFSGNNFNWYDIEVFE